MHCVQQETLIYYYLLPYFGHKYRREMRIFAYLCLSLSNIARKHPKIKQAQKNGGGFAAPIFVGMEDFGCFTCDI